MSRERGPYDPTYGELWRIRDSWADKAMTLNAELADMKVDLETQAVLMRDLEDSLAESTEHRNNLARANAVLAARVEELEEKIRNTKCVFSGACFTDYEEQNPFRHPDQ